MWSLYSVDKISESVHTFCYIAKTFCQNVIENDQWKVLLLVINKISILFKPMGSVIIKEGWFKKKKTKATFKWKNVSPLHSTGEKNG